MNRLRFDGGLDSEQRLDVLTTMYCVRVRDHQPSTVYQKQTTTASVPYPSAAVSAGIDHQPSLRPPMAVVISAMAPNCTPSLSLHGSSRLSRASSGAMPPPPPPPALAQKDVPDTLFTDEEFQALMSGQCELLSFSENNHQSPSPLLSLQLQAQMLCRDEGARFQQETPPFALDDDDDLEEPISDEEIERLAALFSDEEIQAIFAAPQEETSMQFSSSPPRSTDDHAGKKRMSSSPPWPSCIADDDDDDDDEDAGPPPPPPPPPTKKARTTKTNSTTRSAPPPIKKKARTQTKTRSRPEHAAARAAELRCRLRKWHNRIANRILTRQFRAPELSRGRTALRCQCTELALAPDAGDERFGCCALHQDALLPGDRAWMYSAQGHAPPLVGGPGEVLVPSVSAGCSKAIVRQYARWRRSVSLPTRFYVQRAVEMGLARLPDDDSMMPEY